ncbi:MAG: hypothetical protein R3E18_09035 [Sphingomonadaceae bacterium]|nr:hypothetical protein [Sphingomonadaceae bacterium]
MAAAMPIKITRVSARNMAVAAGVAVLAACATPVPPPPPPPPPVQKIIPPRPVPPGGAAYIMEIPPLGVDGLRMTVNRGLSNDERTWHFRSAWNVAALNCVSAEQQPILDAYSSYISVHARTLSAVNSRIDAAYRKNYSSSRDAIRARESKMTSVYNFFTLPAARRDFCNAALDIANRAMMAPKFDANEFAAANFSIFEQPFETFYNSYEQYQRDSAAWDAEYGAEYGASQPGYVAVHGTPAQPTDAGSSNSDGGG